jgi:hypothetical protein
MADNASNKGQQAASEFALFGTLVGAKGNKHVRDEFPGNFGEDVRQQ